MLYLNINSYPCFNPCKFKIEIDLGIRLMELHTYKIYFNYLSESHLLLIFKMVWPKINL